MLLILVLLLIQIIGGLSSPVYDDEEMLSVTDRNGINNHGNSNNTNQNDNPETICPSLKKAFNGVTDKSVCSQCGDYKTACYLNISFLTNQNSEWNKILLNEITNNIEIINEKCSVYNNYYNGETSSSDTKKSNNCKNYLKTLMKPIDIGTSPRCLYDNIFKSQNYAICV